MTDLQWYQTDPMTFINSHIPFDPIWQLLDSPLNYEQIKNSDFTSKALSKFNYQDSIRIVSSLSDHDKRVATLKRIKTMGTHNRLVEQYVLQNQNYIDYLEGYEKLQLVYNSLQKNITYLNAYIYSKNKQFRKPVWSDEMLQSFSIKMKASTDSLDKLLSAVSRENVQNATYQAELQTQLAGFSKILNNELAFIDKYLSTWKPLRIKHFYIITGK